MFEQSKTEPKEKEIKTTPLMLYRVCVYVCIYIGMMKIELVLNNGILETEMEWKELCFEEEIITRLVCELCVSVC